MSIIVDLQRALCRMLPSQGVCLFYWQPKRGTNFGDELSMYVVSRLLRSLLGSSKTLQACHEKRCIQRRLFAIGSILHECRSGDTVWGSGINGKVGSRGYTFSGVDFRAVRGPLTRELVLKHGGNCPPVFGDPGLMFAKLFPEFDKTAVRRAERKVTFIPNLNDAVMFDRHSIAGTGVTYVSPSSNWKMVINEIRSSSLVLASSLHGIVLSDVYHVPCRPLVSMFEAPFKFEDYFLATGRDQVGYARNIKEALELGPVPKANIDLDPLVEAFPSDIFQR